MHCAADECTSCWHCWPALAPQQRATSGGASWLALGLDLRLSTAAEGGRQNPLLLDTPFRYRPNWGLAGMPELEQIGAPVLYSSAVHLPPGGRAHVVIVPLAEQSLPLWRELRPGDTIRLYEGPRVCGLAMVVWVADTWRPMPDSDAIRFRDWVSGRGDWRP
jgi:hypothetical protein